MAQNDSEAAGYPANPSMIFMTRLYSALSCHFLAQEEKPKKTAYQFLYSGSITSFMLVILGVYEELVVPEAIIGSILLISFLIAHDYVNRSKDEKALDY